MSLTRYKIFNTIIEEGGFLKAANKLKMTQSAVSHAISSLEFEFGFKILIRGHSGVDLTNNGRKMLFHVRHLLNIHEKMNQEAAEIKGVKTGVVNIGTFPSVSINLLPKIIKEFKEFFPQIEIKILEGNYENISSWLTKEIIDFGFLSLPTKNMFDVITLTEDKIICIMSNQHSLSHKKIITFEQLKKECLIMPKTNIDNDVRNILKTNNVTSNIKYEMKEDQAIIAMVQHNLGITVLPELTLYRLPSNIRKLNLETEHHRKIGLASLSFKKATPAAKSFLKFVQSM